jgi:1A family penicillin-binding protein
MQTTRIFDRYGNLLYELSDEGRRTIVALDQVPLALIQATIATEDKNFYGHGGVDLEAVGRAMVQNWLHSGIVSGASTIPQQLVRNLLMSEAERRELSMNRKMREAFLALDLDNKYSKDEILEMYLNTVYYGHQAYGVAAAAETYFRKTLDKLTLAEIALLAGLPQSPATYDPLLNARAAFIRQRIVLDLMEQQGYIDAEHKAEAMAEQVRIIAPPLPVLRAPHFVDHVRSLLLERYGPEGIHSGLQVHTSIDLRYQQLAEEIARAHLEEIGGRYKAANAAVVVLHPPTGQVLALVGSLDYYNEAIDGQVNMATHRRQPGSAIKPVLYAAAFEHGWTPASVIWDAPISYQLASGIYAPHNVTGRHYGALRLRAALANSLNVPAIKLLYQIGVPTMLQTAAKMGIHAWKAPEESYGLALALGGYEVSLLELTNAFATLANHGLYAPASPITRIEDGAGRVIFDAAVAAPPRQSISPVAAYQVTSILSDARTRTLVFPGDSALNTSQPTAVKTGTTDDWRDNLAVGYTPYLAVGVWVGNSDAKPMKNAYGFLTAAPIWHDIFETVWAAPSLHPALGYAGRPLPVGFDPPPGIVAVPVCDLLTGRFNRNCPLAYEEVLAAPTGPTPNPTALESDGLAQQRGYCLPLLQAEMPPAIQSVARFVPMPRDSRDRNAARNWAERYGMDVASFGDCEATAVHRQLSGQPPLPNPELLIFLPPRKTATSTSQAAGVVEGGRVALGEIAARGLNLRARPGLDATILGSLRHGQIAVIRQGPAKADGESWYQIRVLDNGLVGWGVGRFLRALPAADTEMAVAAPASAPAATPTH